MGRVGRGFGRIELGGREDAVAEACFKIGRIGGVGEVGGHERREVEPDRKSGQDALAVGLGRRGGRYRRDQVRHDDGAGELLRRIGQHGLEHGTVAQMDMPIIGAADGQARDVGHGGWSGRCVRQGGKFGRCTAPVNFP
jgi:hypothetical protein